MNDLVLSLIAKRADVSTLEILSRVPEFADVIETESASNHSWYERVRLLVNFDIEFVNTDWRQVYNVLEDAATGQNPFRYEGSLSNEINSFNIVAVKLLLRLGFDPSADNVALTSAIRFGSIEAVKLLLEYDQVRNNPRQVGNALVIASKSGSVELVSLLLQQTSLLGSYINRALTVSVSKDSAMVVQLLLQDSRVDPNYDDMIVIQTAAPNPSFEVVSSLLSDKRVVITKESILTAASQNTNSRVLELLLTRLRLRGLVDYVLLRRVFQAACTKGMVGNVEYLLKDPEVHPEAYKSSILIATISERQTEVVKLLLNDSRTNPAAKDDSALREAILVRAIEITKLLLLDDRVDVYGDITRSFLLSSDSQIDYLEPVVQALSSNYRAFTSLQNYIIKYVQDNITKTGHYDILLREILLRRQTIGACLRWLIAQQLDSSYSLPSRLLVQRAVRSLDLTGKINHYDNVFFTAYRGLFLFATQRNVDRIIGILKSEIRVSEDGLLKAKMLIYALDWANN